MAIEPTVIPLRPESPRYTPTLGLVGGLFAGPAIWTPFAGYLAHRGWAGAILDLRGVAGGLDERARAVAGYVRGLPEPPILIGHDLGFGCALEAARGGAVRGIVGLAPLVAGHPVFQGIATRALWALLLRRVVGVAPAAAALSASPDLSPALRTLIARDMRPEPPAAVRSAARPQPIVPAGVPTLLAVGERDPLLDGSRARALADALGAERGEIAGAGHWLSCGAGWQQAVAVVHRWAVRGLPAGALDFYAEAMAERGDDENEK